MRWLPLQHGQGAQGWIAPQAFNPPDGDGRSSSTCFRDGDGACAGHLPPVIPAVGGGPGLGVEARGAWGVGEEKEGTQTSPSCSECNVKTPVKCMMRFAVKAFQLQRRSYLSPPQCLGVGADPPGRGGRLQLGKGRSSWPRQGRGHRPQESRPLRTDRALFRQKRRHWQTLQVPHEKR